MSSARWQDLAADVASAKEHYREAVRVYRSTSLESLGQYWNKMAFQHAMYSGYTSFEAFLERLLTMLREPLPVGRDWHAKLLERVAAELPESRPALIGDDLRAAADLLLRFRHVALHSYDRFDPALAEPSVVAAESFLELIDRDVARIKDLFDPD